MRWMQIASDLTSFGGKPIPEIEHYFAAAGHPDLIDDDLAWGVAVVGTCLAKSGVMPPKTLTGKAYLGIGTPVATPRPGAIAVISIDSDAAAHRIAFVYSVKGEQVVAIGGHKAGLVSLDLIPRNKVLAFRWPMSTKAADWLKDVPAKVETFDPLPAVAPPAPPPPSPEPRPDPASDHVDVVAPVQPVTEGSPADEEGLPPMPPIAAYEERVAFEPSGDDVRHLSFKEILARVHKDGDEDESDDPAAEDEPPVDPGVYTDPWPATGPDPLPPPPADPRKGPAPEDDEKIRHAALKRITEAAHTAAASSMADQIRYELAMQAKNGSAYAIDLFSGEAAERGMTIEDLASEVIETRKRQERRMMKVHEVAARLAAAVEIAAAPSIDAITSEGIATIEATGKETRA